MAKKFIKFPSIEQFRTIVKNVQTSSAFVGLDEDEQPIFDNTRPKPVINFTGTVKLHGTNAGVGYDGEEIWAQKRGGICTIEKDNAGFAFFVESRKEHFKQLFSNIHLVEGEQAVIFGEWCGGNIQKGVGISGLDKMFVIFDIKIVSGTGEVFWMSPLSIQDFYIDGNEFGIHNILNFQTWNIDVDFARPEVAQQDFIKLTEAVEKECPVAKYFGVDSGVGEGIVWRTHYKGDVHRFKVKGERHSSSRVKTLSAVDVEKIASYREFADYACTKNRMDQAVKEVFGEEEPTKKGTPDFLRWVVNDIAKEEMDTMVENKLEPKDVNKYISEKARIWLFNIIDRV